MAKISDFEIFREGVRVIRFVTVFTLVVLAVALMSDAAFSEEPKNQRKSSGRCELCLDMVEIPSGSGVMGVSRDDFPGGKVDPIVYLDESPRHSVAVKGFYLQKFNITKRQFSKFARETGFRGEGCVVFDGATSHFIKDASWENPGFKQTDLDPVVCVSWDDAQKYIEWLNSKTDRSERNKYRLPTEDEWEYAARSGTEAVTYWGGSRSEQCKYENARDKSAEVLSAKSLSVTCDDGYIYTSPVGKFLPNRWGLFDMLGNARQWIADCSHIGYRTGYVRNSAIEDIDCSMRVARGGSWASVIPGVRAAARYAFKPGERQNTLGFRLAQDKNLT